MVDTGAMVPIARCPGCGAAVDRGETVGAPGGPAAAQCLDRFGALLAASYQDASRRAHHFALLSPPRFDGTAATAASVLAAPGDAYAAELRRWATEVWRAWLPQREVVIGWLAESAGR